MTLFTAKWSSALLGLSVLLGGCAQVGPTQYRPLSISADEQAIIASKPTYLRSDYTALFKEGSRNQVLHLMEIGKKAFVRGDLKNAAEAFDQAIRQVELVYANSDSATKARSLWHEEGAKDFKGEPYERSMLYYYRGLVYLAKEDYENARASFVNAIMQDAFAEEQQNRSDMISQLFLMGWSAQKMGSHSLAKQAFNEIKTLSPNFVPPPRSHDVLIIAESGSSPRKLADGVGHHQLVYRRGKKITDYRVKISDGKRQFEVPIAEDVYWQASSRGGRQIDKIIDGKVAFKSVTENLGTALADVGTTSMWLIDPYSSGNIGAGMSLLGVGAMAISAQARVRADTRYWDNLPNQLHFITLRSKDIRADKLKVIYMNKQGKSNKAVSPQLVFKGHKETFVWSSGEHYD